MFGQPGGGRRRIQEIATRFREKGATSPEKAMTIEELGLPPKFEMAMRRRLGATGVFVEVSGKYYLNEARLQQFQQQRAEWFRRSGREWVGVEAEHDHAQDGKDGCRGHGHTPGAREHSFHPELRRDRGSGDPGRCLGCADRVPVLLSRQDEEQVERSGTDGQSAFAVAVRLDTDAGLPRLMVFSTADGPVGSAFGQPK